MRTIDAQGHQKSTSIFPGMIISFYGAAVPSGWFLCDGTNNTPDLRSAFIVGASAVGTGSGAGTGSAELAHTAFASTEHSNHIVTQPGAHSAHSPTQPATHDVHANGGSHQHDSHTTAMGLAGINGLALTGPELHNTQGTHAHDAHAAHSAFATDAHSAHTGTAVDAHSAHAMTQPTSHNLKRFLLVFCMKA